jgi:hypothetical protein
MLLHPSGALVRQCLPRKPRRAIAVLHPLQCALHITCTPSQFVHVIKVPPSYTNSPPLTPTCKPATAAYNLTTTPHHHHLSPDSYTHPSPLTRLNPTHGKPRYPAPECRVRCIPEGINATVPHTAVRLANGQILKLPLFTVTLHVSIQQMTQHAADSALNTPDDIPVNAYECRCRRWMYWLYALNATHS